MSLSRIVEAAILSQLDSYQRNVSDSLDALCSTLAPRASISGLHFIPVPYLPGSLNAGMGAVCVIRFSSCELHPAVRAGPLLTLLRIVTRSLLGLHTFLVDRVMVPLNALR